MTVQVLPEIIACSRILLAYALLKIFSCDREFLWYKQLHGIFTHRAFLADFLTGGVRLLRPVKRGFTGFSALVIEDGIARVYLNGPCRSNGATYTIAQPVIANLSQFEQIHTVKIYDAEGTTENPDGPGNSISLCLEP